ncbi:sulfite reductase subunit alpha [uncultured Pseudoxanthomonas sp.]|uniref:sulfite reductase subunit alpha n=1 Tax=uncultured Pseudoxanthomonas sp. TaxID=281701 RepID=UPI0026396002|nr:sulfite reductase subunit alpha [uncultured Pseudoxanthomonas sp.]
MSAPSASARRSIAPLIGNACAMALLVACAWWLGGLHDAEGWQAMPSTTRRQAALAAVLAYAGLVAACLYRARARDRSARPAPRVPQDAIWVVHASQTGFAMELADLTAAALRKGGVSVQRAALERLDETRLAGITRALFVVSTTGEGDPPDPALGFVRRVMPLSLSLDNLQYAVLALGDREYDHFCAFGHQLDDWLRKHHAKPLFDLIEVDNADDSALRHWQHHIGQLGNGNEAPDWAPPRYGSWQLRHRVNLNPGSMGGPAFHLVLEPAEGALPSWTAGDIAEIGPRRAAGDVEEVLRRIDKPGNAKVRWQDEVQPLASVLARTRWPDLATMSTATDAQALADACTPLPHREYSIASLPADGGVHLLVRMMQRADGVPGLGSGWLCRYAQPGDAIALRIRRNPNFHPPSPHVPMILIGNGTGLAGLRAHLRARVQAGAARNWLLFGERQRAHDFFHGDELLAWQANGMLEHLDLAFSRDGSEHRYVQHALLARADRLRQWIAEGAVVYVCGSLAGMAPEVEAVLCSLLGEDHVDILRAEGRYRRDVY